MNRDQQVKQYTLCFIFKYITHIYLFIFDIMQINKWVYKIYFFV